MDVVIVNCFDTYEHRVDYICDFFRKRGDRVKVYTSNFRHFEKKVRDDSKEGYIYIKAIPYYKNISVIRMVSHFKLSKDIFKCLKNETADLIWVLIPPNSFIKSIYKYKKRNAASKIVFDVIDMWPETFPINKVEWIPLIKMWKNMRDKWISKADFLITECDLYQDKFNSIISKNKVKTIYLAREIKPFTGKPNLPKDKLVLCYLGSINNIIDIPTIVNIINFFKKNLIVELHIIGDGEKREKLISEASGAGATVIYHGKVFDAEEKQKIFDTCHFGLNIMKDSVYVGLTMKSIDYFEAGLPIINNIHGDTWHFVEENKVGINVDGLGLVFSIDNLEIREKVRHFYEDKFGISSFEQNLDYVVNDNLFM